MMSYLGLRKSIIDVAYKGARPFSSHQKGRWLLDSPFVKDEVFDLTKNAAFWRLFTVFTGERQVEIPMVLYFIENNKKQPVLTLKPNNEVAYHDRGLTRILKNTLSKQMPEALFESPDSKEFTEALVFHRDELDAVLAKSESSEPLLIE